MRRLPPRMNAESRAAARGSLGAIGFLRREAALTFAGLTWRWFGIFCVVLVVLAASRPTFRNAVAASPGAWPIAVALVSAYVIVWLRFVPVLLAVIAAANRAPRRRGRAVAWITVAAVAGSMTGSVLAMLAMPLVLGKPGMLGYILEPGGWRSVVRWVGLASLDLMLIAMATAFGFYVKRSMEARDAVLRQQHQGEEAQRENAQARLSLMQAQIEPHFLFNSLASIRRLYETDPPRGRAMLRHLSSYLEASLPTLRESQSTLGRELALAVAYLNVQKIRMGARLDVVVDVPAHLLPHAVPPMMLATLAENAIIHGVAPLPEGGAVSIAARAQDDRIVVEVADTGRGLRDTWGAGVGLANIQARLRSEFGGRASFDLRPGARGGVVASIGLPLDALPARAA